MLLEITALPVPLLPRSVGAPSPSYLAAAEAAACFSRLLHAFGLSPKLLRAFGSFFPSPGRWRRCLLPISRRLPVFGSAPFAAAEAADWQGWLRRARGCHALCSPSAAALARPCRPAGFAPSNCKSSAGSAPPAAAAPPASVSAQPGEPAAHCRPISRSVVKLRTVQLLRVRLPCGPP